MNKTTQKQAAKLLFETRPFNSLEERRACEAAKHSSPGSYYICIQWENTVYHFAHSIRINSEREAFLAACGYMTIAF